jgi:polyribonucleotide nucleotidyltransferase
MEEKIIKKTFELAGRTLTAEAGKMARQANGSVFLQYGDTAVLAAVTMSKTASDNMDFFPLTVDYVEKMFAAGKIPGGFFKREAKPSTQATLTSRVIDRAIRPLFPDGFRNSVHVVITTLSYDEKNDPRMLGLIGASLALTISDIPFNGPIAAVSVGMFDDVLRVNPFVTDMDDSKLDLTVAGSEKSVVMIEGGAEEVNEETMMEAIYKGHEVIKELVAFQNDFAAGIAKPKLEVTLKTIPEDLIAQVYEEYGSEVKETTKIVKKLERSERLDEIKKTMLEKFEQELDEKDYSEKEPQLKEAFKTIVSRFFRDAAVKEGRRVDGRGFDEIRPIRCEIDVLPRVHGSALFTRGETQSICVVTLGSATDEQIIDGLEEEYKKPFFLHYNFPPFCVGEAGFLRGPGRRELGHGALAERALDAVMPTKDDFPYTIRIVSDILESNGSSSMATVCGGSLALMAAGVPIKKPVAGVANGLIVEDGKTIILTDITGTEDHLGDMDFKVTGTRDGITAVQMDIKVEGITKEVMLDALNRSRVSRLSILDIMDKVISAGREELSPYAPRIETIKVDVDKIGTVIGPGGKMIKSIIETTKVSIDINDDGTINIASPDGAAIEKAKAMIHDLVAEPEINEVYEGKISRIEPYGAFVKFMGGCKEGLVHVSQIHYARVENVSDYMKVGDTVMVRYTGSDRGKVQLTMKGVPGNEELNKNIKENPGTPSDRPPRDDNRDRGRDDRRDRYNKKGRY